MKQVSDLFEVIAFLKQHTDTARPVLLAYSGGSDSTALLHLISSFKSVCPLNLHLVHVDHGWRSSSHEEALMLQSLAKEYQLPFHLRVVQGVSPLSDTNLEDIYRQKRYALFQEVYESIGAQGLILAHHQDDLVETTLKRIFEGASPSSLYGMSPVSFGFEMRLLRPLLTVPKQKINEYLLAHQLSYIKDETNEDSAYLRPRMRKELIPLLEASFGKKIKAPLSQLALESHRLKLYLESRVLPRLSSFYPTCYGGFMDFLEEPSLEDIEIEALLKRIFQYFNVTASYSFLRDASVLISQKTSGKTLIIKNLELQIDRGRVFFFNQLHSSQLDFAFKKEEGGVFSFGSLSFKIEALTQAHEASDIIDLFKKGKMALSLPSSDFSWEKADLNQRIESKTLKERLQEEKIPSFLWGLPILKLRNGEIAYPWLKKLNKGVVNTLCTIDRPIQSEKNSLELKDKFSTLC